MIEEMTDKPWCTDFCIHQRIIWLKRANLLRMGNCVWWFEWWVINCLHPGPSKYLTASGERVFIVVIILKILKWYHSEISMVSPNTMTAS